MRSIFRMLVSVDLPCRYPPCPASRLFEQSGNYAKRAMRWSKWNSGGGIESRPFNSAQIAELAPALVCRSAFEVPNRRAELHADNLLSTSTGATRVGCLAYAFFLVGFADL